MPEPRRVTFDPTVTSTTLESRPLELQCIMDRVVNSPRYLIALLKESGFEVPLTDDMEVDVSRLPPRKSPYSDDIYFDLPGLVGPDGRLVVDEEEPTSPACSPELDISTEGACEEQSHVCTEKPEQEELTACNSCERTTEEETSDASPCHAPVDLDRNKDEENDSTACGGSKDETDAELSKAQPNHNPSTEQTRNGYKMAVMNILKEIDDLQMLLKAEGYDGPFPCQEEFSLIKGKLLRE